MNILIDAFGGDNAPLEVIRGGAQAVQELGVTVTLVGDEQKIRDCAEENGLPLDGMEILHAPAVFDIHEEPTSLLKQHADTSMAVGMQALHDGKGCCDAVWTGCGRQRVVCAAGHKGSYHKAARGGTFP